MNALYYARVERRDFGGLLSVSGLSALEIKKAPGYDALQVPEGDTVVAVWSEDPKESAQLPHLLVCRDGTEADWSAWITTFAPRIRPFSAYMRLLTGAHLKKVQEETRTPSLGPLVWPVAGLVLGEVLAALRLPDNALDALSAATCESTLSFAMFRAAATYHDFGQWAHLVEAWESVRRMTKQRARPVDGLSVARVCGTIMEAGGLRGADQLLKRSDMKLSAACQDLITSPTRVPTALSKIPEFEEAEAMMHGPRENRVLAIEEFIGRLDRMSVQDPELMSFMLGYLASRIAPGTIQHSSVLAPVLHRYPIAALWYGFCAGFGDAETSMSSVNGRRALDLPGSARRVARDLLGTDPDLGPPVCDIAFLELVALSRTAGDPLGGLITTTQGAAIVELAPFVWTAVNVSSKPLAEAPRLEQRERTIIATMGRQIDLLREMYEDLVRGEDPNEPDDQPSLFPQKRRRK